MNVDRIVTGFVIQTYDADTGKCISQDFVAGDQEEWEDEEGDPIIEGDEPEIDEFPLQMIQPKKRKK